MLAVLVKELVHTLLPLDAGHGKLFKRRRRESALRGRCGKPRPGRCSKIVLQSDRRPGWVPCPMRSLNIEQQPMTTRGSVAVDAPKKQGTRYRKAECAEEGCGFTVRVAASQVKNIGAPHCPRHGEMKVDMPSPGAEEDLEENNESFEAA